MKSMCPVCDWPTERDKEGKCLVCNPPKVPDKVLEEELGQATLFEIPPPTAA